MIALLFLFIIFVLLQNASQNQGVEISVLGTKRNTFIFPTVLLKACTKI